MTDDRYLLHLAPLEHWEAGDPAQPYRPESFARDGFVHTTLGAENLADTANRYYRADPRSFVVLVIDTSRLSSAVRHDDGGGIYPHIYGPVDREAVVAVIPAGRHDDGAFLPPDIRHLDVARYDE